jgi:hypothetical protein
LAGCFFNDSDGVFQTRQNSKVVSNGSSKTSTLTNVTSGGTTQWLILCRPQGVVEVRETSYHKDWRLNEADLDFAQIDAGFLYHRVINVAKRLQ